jgi:hypothetical protein
MQWSRLEAKRLAMCASLFLASCGPCGNVKQINLRSVPPSQLVEDRALFKESTSGFRALYVTFTLSELNLHPSEARIFEQLGYVRQAGRKVKLTILGAHTSRHLGEGELAFYLEQPHRLGAVQFTSETEETLCNEAHETFRTYGWNESVGPFTPLGLALFNNKSLYIGSYTEGHRVHPHLWLKLMQPLHEIFGFDPEPALRKPVKLGGETLDFRWSKYFVESGI